MSQTLTYIADQSGERVDTFLARSAPAYSRSFWQKRCEEGRVKTGDKPVRARQKLQLGDVVQIELREAPNFSDLGLPIIYEDADVVVIDKPAGVLTHTKGGESSEFTVADFLRPRTTDGKDTNRPGIVHRLDRGTSGVIIAAKNSEAKRWLQAQFSKRAAKKTYLALVHGHLKEPRALLELPIERNPRRPQTFRIGANGKPAETSYHVLRSYHDYDLVELKPLTGRTHQLRVHMHYLGHPIVGDPTYGQPDKVLDRMFLHAQTLELTLPSRERKVFTAPLPSELQHFLNELKG